MQLHCVKRVTCHPALRTPLRFALTATKKKIHTMAAWERIAAPVTTLTTGCCGTSTTMPAQASSSMGRMPILPAGTAINKVKTTRPGHPRFVPPAILAMTFTPGNSAGSARGVTTRAHSTKSERFNDQGPVINNSIPVHCLADVGFWSVGVPIEFRPFFNRFYTGRCAPVRGLHLLPYSWHV